MTCVEVKKEHKLPTPNMKHKRKDTGENFLSSKPTIIKKKRTVTPHSHQQMVQIQSYNLQGFRFNLDKDKESQKEENNK